MLNSTIPMNAIPHDRVEAGGEPRPVDVEQIAAERRRRRRSALETWLSQSPFYLPFKKVTAPFFSWMAEPTNAIGTVVVLALAPFVALLLLPLFLILVPVFLFFAVLGSMATTVKTDADSEEHESMTQHFLH